MSLKRVLYLVVMLLSFHTAEAVVNGEDVQTQDHPEMALLLLSAKKLGPEQKFITSLNGFSVCSGAFISDRMVLTAGHCLRNSEGPQYAYLASPREQGYELLEPIASQTEYVYENLQPPEGEQICSVGAKPLFESQTTDVSLLTFPAGTVSHWYKIDLNYQPRAGQKLYYLGYGMTKSPFDGGVMMLVREPTLKAGRSEVWRTNSQRVGFLADIMKSFAADGDSGGPVFVGDKIVGVMSTLSEHCETQFGEDYALLNTATLLSSPQARNFIERNLTARSNRN